MGLDTVWPTQRTEATGVLPEELHQHSAFFLLAVVSEAQHDDALGQAKLCFVAEAVAQVNQGQAGNSTEPRLT